MGLNGGQTPHHTRHFIIVAFHHYSISSWYQFIIGHFIIIVGYFIAVFFFFFSFMFYPTTEFMTVKNKDKVEDGFQSIVESLTTICGSWKSSPGSFISSGLDGNSSLWFVPQEMQLEQQLSTMLWRPSSTAAILECGISLRD